jgi:hypothetical protein
MFFIFQVVGKLAAQKPKDGDQISGILVKRNFNYHIMDPSDLSSMYCVNNMTVAASSIMLSD